MDIFDTFDSILIIREEGWWDVPDPSRVMFHEGRVLPVFLDEEDEP